MLQTPSKEVLVALVGKQLTITELLLLFGARMRNDQSVLVIGQAFKDAGLSTLPHFATCSHGAVVSVLAQQPSAEAEVATEDEPGTGLSSGALPQQSYKIGDLPAAQDGVECVSSSDTLTAATHLMRDKNFSQVPVMDNRYAVRGVVSWRSVANMYATGLDPVLKNAMVEEPIVVEAHQDLFSLLPLVRTRDFVLVRSAGGQIGGIVTAADITDRFGATARPFFLVGEIEARLRKCLGKALAADNICALQSKKRQTGQISDLSFGDYVKLLDAEQNSQNLCELADVNWKALGWVGVDRRQFVHQLDRVRSIRNKIAHFDPEPLTRPLIDELERFARSLRQLVI